MSRIKFVGQMIKKYPYIFALDVVSSIVLIAGMTPYLPFLPCLGIAVVGFAVEIGYLRRIPAEDIPEVS